jgi:hypothetical protein
VRVDIITAENPLLSLRLRYVTMVFPKRRNRQINKVLFIMCILLLSFPVHAGAETFTLLDKFPGWTNGENNVFLQFRSGDTYVNLKRVAVYTFGNPDGPDQPPPMPPMISLKIPGSSGVYIWTKPGSLQSNHPLDSVIRVTIPGEGGQVQVKGFAGNASIGLHFSIYKGEEQYESPIWSTDTDASFDITIPYQKNDQLFFSVRENSLDPTRKGYWKDVTLITPSLPGTSQELTGTVQSQTGLTQNGSQYNGTPVSQSSGTVSGGGDNYFLFIVGGAVAVMVAGGGFFVMRRRGVPERSSGTVPPPEKRTDTQSPAPAETLAAPEGVLPGQTQLQSGAPVTFPRELLSQYREAEYLGQGGFARIFKAKRKDGIQVAVKVPLSMDAATGKTFVAELRNWTRLDHENIVKIYDYNVIPIPYFEMELCDNSLTEMKKPIPPGNAAWLLFYVCEGLKCAHAHNIIHRDLKPQNILIKNGIPKLSDWGLSKILTESKASSTQTSFTPYYAAPEQISGKPKDPRTDIWQLGVIFYEMVTGELPFKGDSMVEVMAGIATKDPKQPSQISSAARDVEPVIMKCIEKDPGQRYQSVIALQKDLAAYLKLNYSESLKKSVSDHDLTRSAYYCGDLLLVNMKTGDLVGAYKYAADLAHYAQGDVKVEAGELADQIHARIEMNISEIPEELVQKADVIVHRVRVETGR